MANKWTLAQLTTEVEYFLDDTSNERWTEAEIHRCIRDAIRLSTPLWYEEREDSSQTYDEDTFRYTLPPTCFEVEEVWFAALSDDLPRYFVVPNTWHVEDTYLVFTHKYSNYDGQTMYIRYTVRPQNLLTCSGSNGVVASGDLDALTATGETFITDGVLVGDVVELAQGTFYVESVDSETQVTLDRDGTAGTSLAYYVARYTDLPIMYIKYMTAALLYELSGRHRHGLTMEECVALARYYRALAMDDLRRQMMHRPPRRRY